ncbi:unnamed protein product, partial [Ilex paraguariensis]
EMNSRLLSLVIDSEIVRTTKQLGDFKAPWYFLSKALAYTGRGGLQSGPEILCRISDVHGGE